MPLTTDLETRANGWTALGLTVLLIAGGWTLADQDIAWELHQGISQNTTASFDTAKERLYNEVDLEPDGTYRCVYSGTRVGNQTKDDGLLKPREDGGVQVEHTWACNARWLDASYHFDRNTTVEGADLHHLFPARQGINGSRGNLPFGELPDDARQLWVDADGSLAAAGAGTPSGSFRDQDARDITVFEPRDDHKGNVARAMFYMSVRYWLPLDDDMERDLREWNVLDPVDAAERERNAQIETIQGNRNPFIDDPALIDEIADF
ncbi:endonuclease [bacterium]|nr:endonuclease [bacterium]MBU1072803.1 endonuclease [bacterium]MBU1674801.1 endonuclease [bacterium]